MLTELDHSERLKKITSTIAKFTSALAFKSIQVTFLRNHCNDDLKFHMQHDKAAVLQKNKIQATWESNMAAVAKNS